MPYISETRRDLLRAVHRRAFPSTSGELNFLITDLIVDYVRNQTHTSGYGAINDVLGALEGAKLEFYRRVVGPYEEGKMVENGDIY